jgi:hypothetical protein
LLFLPSGAAVKTARKYGYFSSSMDVFLCKSKPGMKVENMRLLLWGIAGGYGIIKMPTFAQKRPTVRLCVSTSIGL